MRGLGFQALMYALMGVMGVIGAPVCLWRETWTRAWQKTHNRAVFLLLGLIFGVRVEVRGSVPDGDVLIAAKHQSMLDVLLLFNALPRARFAMKRELMWMPVFGLYAWRTGAVALNRRPRHGAAEDLVRAFADVPGQIVIYPQGTRVAPGVEAPYRRGIARMAEATGRRIVPVATNAGLFWRKGGLFHGPGVAVIEFLEPVSGALPRNALMAELTARIEAASDRLCSEGATP